MKVKVRFYELVDRADEEIKTYVKEVEIPPERENRHSWPCQNCSLGDIVPYPDCRNWCQVEGYEAVKRREERNQKRRNRN